MGLGASFAVSTSEKYAEPAKESISFEHVSDQLTKGDTLGFKPYVEAIAGFLTSSGTKAPLTLSIEGEWGSGKSSFMAQLEDSLVRKKHLTVSFNAWRHDSEDSLWAAFALNFIDQLSSQQPWRKRWWGRIKLLSKRLNWKNWEVLRSLAVWFVVIGVIIAVIGFLILKGFQEPDSLYEQFVDSNYSLKQVIRSIIDYGLIALGSVFALMGTFVSFWLKLKKTVGYPFDVDFSKYFNTPDYEGRVDFIENFHKDFKNIVKAYAGEHKVYVLIDDLDRCEVPKAADLMQAINLMISYDPHLIFIVGMDREKVAASIAVKHEKLLPYLYLANSEPIDTSRQGLKYGYAFIEKFIQISFSVPKPTRDDFEKFLEDLSKPAGKIDIESNKLKNILNQFKKYLKSWGIKHPETDGNKNEIEKIGDETPEDKAHREEEEAREKEKTKIEERRQTIILELDKDSKRIRDIILMVAPALDNNPRRIKQFTNLFRLRTYIAAQTGLFDITEDSPAGEQLTFEQLGKFVAISLKWPLLLKDLDANRSLLAQLQKGTIGGGSKEYDYWYKVEKLMDLLRAGMVDDNHTIIDPVKGWKYSLSGLNVDKLSRISPRVTSLEGDGDIEDAPNHISLKDIGMKFTRIEAGDFMMGALKDKLAPSDKTPVHKVTISKPFELGTYLVTQREWKAVMGNNPSRFKGDNLPVDNVSWNDVQDFIKRLNQKEGVDKYRLPSEAEWEYACRAGTTTQHFFGDDASMLGEYAWYADIKTYSVGRKNPNPWGLYDMYGNAWEWVQDKWHDNYDDAPKDGSAWESGGGSSRVIRGGGWHSGVQDCRSAFRGNSDSGTRDYSLGFRLLRNL